MTSQREWFPDRPEYISVQSDPDTRAPVTYRITDAYSQWIAKHGAKFAYTEEIPKVHDDDFNYVLVIKEKNGVFEFRFEEFDFRSPPIHHQGADPDGSAFLGRLPIRHRAAGITGTFNTQSTFLNRSNLLDKLDKKRLVIVGLIDDAINLGHRRFRQGKDQSRIDFAWVQDGINPKTRTAVSFGREFTGDDIAEAIQMHPDDDDSLMRYLDLIADPDDPYLPTALRLHASHGTHVGDLCAGMDPFHPDAAHRRIIAVQLPALASQDTSGTSLMASVIAAAIYIFDRALVLSQVVGYPIPVVLNFSFGFGGGPRNGAHIVERAIRSVAEQYRKDTKRIEYDTGKYAMAPAELIMPAGNGHLQRNHARSPNGPKPRLDLRMRVQPQDRSSSFLEIWFPERTENIGIVVTTPDGIEKPFSFNTTSSDFGKYTIENDWVLGLPDPKDPNTYKCDTIVARVSIDKPNTATNPDRTDDDPTPFWRVVLSLAPTLCQGEDLPFCPHGIWHIHCKGDEKSVGPIRAWIQRDEAVIGFGERGRQAYFDDDIYEDNRFDDIRDVVVTDTGRPASIVKRDGTVSGIATREPCADPGSVITVGGDLWQDNRAAIYSGAGYDEDHSAPHFLAPSEHSRVLGGILATTTRNGGKVALGGTSVAAPQASRLLAEVLQGLNPDEYNMFDAVGRLTELAEEVTRPNGAKELAGNAVIRKERVKMDWGHLPAAGDSKAAEYMRRKTKKKSLDTN